MLRKNNLYNRKKLNENYIIPELNIKDLETTNLKNFKKSRKKARSLKHKRPRHHSYKQAFIQRLKTGETTQK